MSIEINDERPLVKINARDNNKVIVQEVNNQVKISGWGPQGATGPVGPIGPTGPQGESGKYTISETAPTANLEEGDLWFRSSTAQLYFYYDGYWIETSTSYAGPVGNTGPTGPAGTSGLETWTRYSPTFTATGLTFTGTGTTYPTYNSYYLKSGRLVSFVIEVFCTTVTNFGTGQYKLQLPFTPAVGFNHFSGWVWADPNVDPDTGTGHTILNCDTAGITDVLDLHYLKQSGGANSPIREGLLVQGTPVTLTTVSKIYVNGTYIAAAV
jgi:hypothetical protein